MVNKIVKGLLVGLLGILALSGCSVTTPSVFGSNPTPNRTCVDTFEKAFETLKSNGLYECATVRLKVAWFENQTSTDPVTKKTESWNSDKDIDVWLQTIGSGLTGYSPQEFNGDPLKLTDNNGNVTGWEYHVTLWPQYPDGTSGYVGTNFVITIDLSGKISSLV